MNTRNFCILATAVFGIVAIFHAARIWMGWPVVIGGWSVPMWVSWIGFIVAAVLSFFGFRNVRA
jgi:hypothetical protein